MRKSTETFTTKIKMMGTKGDFQTFQKQGGKPFEQIPLLPAASFTHWCNRISCKLLCRNRTPPPRGHSRAFEGSGMKSFRLSEGTAHQKRVQDEQLGLRNVLKLLTQEDMC